MYCVSNNQVLTILGQQTVLTMNYVAATSVAQYNITS